MDAAKAKLKYILLSIAGVIFVGLGILGIFLPVLPTTPFLLLASACFIRSSKRLHGWLLGNRFFGEYLRRYWSGQGMKLSAKIWTLSFLWISLIASAIFVIPDRIGWIRFGLLIVGLGVTIHLLHLPNGKDKRPPRF